MRPPPPLPSSPSPPPGATARQPQASATPSFKVHATHLPSAARWAGRVHSPQAALPARSHRATPSKPRNLRPHLGTCRPTTILMSPSCYYCRRRRCCRTDPRLDGRQCTAAVSSCSSSSSGGGGSEAAFQSTVNVGGPTRPTTVPLAQNRYQLYSPQFIYLCIRTYVRTVAYNCQPRVNPLHQLHDTFRLN